MMYPIRIAAQRTGLSPATLRVWERRYPGIAPGRSDSGRRLYSESELARLSSLSALVRGGFRIGEVVELDDAQLERALAELSESLAVPPEKGPGSIEAPLNPGDTEPEALVERAVNAALAIDTATLEAVIEEAIRLHGQLDVVDTVVFPVTTRLARMAESGEAQPVHQALAEAALERVLARQSATFWGRGPQQASERPLLALAAPKGQKAGVGLLASMSHIFAAGWQPLMLGTNVPVADLVPAVHASGARGVLLAWISDGPDDGLAADLSGLRKRLPAEVPLLFGGRIPASLTESLVSAGLRHVSDMNKLRGMLRKIAA